MKRFYPVIKSKKTGKESHCEMGIFRSVSKSLAVKAMEIEYKKARFRKFDFIRIVEV